MTIINNKLEGSIGNDERQLVTNTNKYPHSSICHLVIWRENGETEYGTGWIISTTCVITAAHNIYHPNSGWANSILVAPGREGRNPDGYDTVFRTAMYVEDKWRLNFNKEYDYGVLKIHAEIGGHYAPFLFARVADDNLKKTDYKCAGYPADKNYGTQWIANGTVLDPTARLFYHNIDTEEGQSGSPVYFIDNNSTYAVVVGIHTAHEKDINRARRIDDALFKNLSTWRDG